MVKFSDVYLLAICLVVNYMSIGQFVGVGYLKRTLDFSPRFILTSDQFESKIFFGFSKSHSSIHDLGLDAFPF